MNNVVDRLRKVGLVLWLNKERLVLFVMVCVLVFQVYKVIFPDEKPMGAAPQLPRPHDPDVIPIPMPSPRPAPSLPGDYASLSRRNPFWYFSGAGRDNRGGQDQEGFEISLVDIQRTGDRLRARLSTASTTKWYNEGESFEQFQLISVDIENKQVTVYIERLGQTRVLSLQ